MSKPRSSDAKKAKKSVANKAKAAGKKGVKKARKASGKKGLKTSKSGKKSVGTWGDAKKPITIIAEAETDKYDKTKRLGSHRLIRTRLHDRDAYLQLVSEFPLVVIQNDAELGEAIAVLDSLLCRGDLKVAEEEYMDTLGSLIADYEDKHHAMEPPTDAGMLQHLMDAKGVTASELAEGTKISKSAISMVLSGTRNFSPKQIAAFSKFFCVSKAVLSANIGDPIEAQA